MFDIRAVASLVGKRVTRGAWSPTDGTFLSLRAGYVRVLIL